MNKSNYLTTTGIFVALAGIIMLVSNQVGITVSKAMVPLFMAVAGIFALLFSKENKQHQLAKLYHKIQGFGLILFAIFIATMPQNLSEFLKFVTYFMLFFGLFELIFAFNALSSGNKLNSKILISRFASGFINSLGAIIILLTSFYDEINSLMLAGVMILLGGISLIVFSIKIRSL